MANLLYNGSMRKGAALRAHSEEVSALAEENREEKSKKIPMIQVKNLYKVYKVGDTKVYALGGVDFTVYKGEFCAIVGPSGSGKSTIAKLMAGFWDTTKGKVIFGGKNIKEIPFAQLMDEVSYVAQDNFLFDESIRENIRIGKPSATDDEVVAAAKAACCHDFIVKLENGYDTNAGDAGGKLSGGERQRITIARAILKNARVIILDEATAYADPENEYLIQSAISKLVKGKTLIVVAHRLATIQNADQILVVENGKIVGCGGQEELLLKCPLYQRLWSDYVSSADQVEGGKV